MVESSVLVATNLPHKRERPRPLRRWGYWKKVLCARYSLGGTEIVHAPGKLARLLDMREWGGGGERHEPRGRLGRIYRRL